MEVSITQRTQREATMHGVFNIIQNQEKQNEQKRNWNWYRSYIPVIRNFVTNIKKIKCQSQSRYLFFLRERRQAHLVSIKWEYKRKEKHLLGDKTISSNNKENKRNKTEIRTTTTTIIMTIVI